MDCIAIDDGDNVIIISNDVKYSIPREDYDYVQDVMRRGVPLTDLNPVVSPSAIIGYLEESNPEAQNVVCEKEAAIAARAANKQNMQILSIGAAMFMLLIGLGALYILVTQTGGGGAEAAAGAASGAFGII